MLSDTWEILAPSSLGVLVPSGAWPAGFFLMRLVGLANLKLGVCFNSLGFSLESRAWEGGI
jgi:hypothetical protein